MITGKLEAKGNILYIDGIKQAWVKVSDIMKFGTSESTLEERFRLCYEDRVNRLLNNNVKEDNKVTTKCNSSTYSNYDNIFENIKQRADNLHNNSEEELLNLIDGAINLWVTELLDIYGKYVNIEREDLKQEIVYYILEYIRDKHIKDKHIKSSNIIILLKCLRRYLNHNINSIFKNYVNYQADYNYIKEYEALREFMYKYKYNISQVLNSSDIQAQVSKELNIRPANTKVLIGTYEKSMEYEEQYSDYMNYGCKYCKDSVEESAVMYKEVVSILASETSRLSERECKVLALRMGFNDNAKTLDETSKALGWHVIRERIRQIESKALRKLRHRYAIKGLYSYLIENT